MKDIVKIVFNKISLITLIYVITVMVLFYNLQHVHVS